LVAGRIKQRVEDIGLLSITWDYVYDKVGRLTDVKKDGSVVESYTYKNGNRETETNTLRGIYDRVFTYSDEDYILTAGADVYQFDKDGFLTEKTTSEGTTRYRYSSRGELLEVNLPDGTVITYDHDPMNRRIAKKINGTIAEKYLWQGKTRLLAVYDGSDNLLMRFNYADARVPVSMEMGGVTYYLTYDQVGSLRAVTDNAGNIIKQVDYDSFGNIISDSNPSFEIPFGFAGGLHDRDTGLVRFGARDYDPVIGRWTAKDPIDFAGGDVNLYGYVQNDPVNWIDPNGLIPTVIGGAIGGAAAGAVAGGIAGAVSAWGSGGSWGDIGRSALAGAGIGALTGGIAGAFLGAGLPGGLGVAADLGWGFDVGLGIGESVALSSKLGAIAGAITGIFTSPDTADGKDSNCP